MSGRVQQLGELTGLDEETVKEQILPYLETFSAKQALVNHLQDLLGPGGKQNTFIQAYANERFPSPKQATPEREDEPSDTRPTTVTPASTGGPRKAKARFPSKLPPPRKVDASSFGGDGAVYRKGQDGDLLFGHNSSGRSTPVENTLGKASPMIPNLSSPARSKAKTPDDANVTSQDAASTMQKCLLPPTCNSKAAREDEFVMVPTEEMKNVQQSIALLRGDSKVDPAIKAKPCFCQGRQRHSVHPLVPLCLTCGLVLCSILSPSPLLLPSPPCPSCASPLLSITNRAILLTRLEMKLDSITQSHKQKMELIIEERQRAWKEKRQEVELFPDLQQKASSSSQQAGCSKVQEYNYFYERRKNIDIAMGRRVEDETQRKGRVLRLESKVGKRKGTVTKKKKQVVGNMKKENIVTDSSPMYSEASEKEDDEVEVEEEPILDYDGEDGNGPVADVEDDGFAQHATFFPPDTLCNSSTSSNWDSSISFLPSISYIAKQDRTKEAIDDDAEDEESDPANRQVPGAALKDSRKKGKGKKDE